MPNTPNNRDAPDEEADDLVMIDEDDPIPNEGGGIDYQPAIRPTDNCAYCGCRQGVHQDAGFGRCSRCNCVGFKDTNETPTIRFFTVYRWAKKWMKVGGRRNMDRLRVIWSFLGDTGYLTYCVCGKSTISNNTTSRTLVKRHEDLACRYCRLCSTCCQCVACSSCDKYRPRNHYCQTCNKCSEYCCKCRSCELCGRQCGGDWDDACARCNTCCRCSDENRVPKYATPPVFHKATKKDAQLNKTSRFIAAEIEVAGIRGFGRSIYEVVKKWGGSIVHDGSLPRGGFEINTSPASGDLYIKQVNEITKSIEKQHGFIDNRCGLHIHIDARDLNYYDIRRLVRTYAVIEKVLFAMVPENRATSRYCKPCGTRYSQLIEAGRLPYEKVKSDIITSVYNEPSTENRRKVKYEQARYNALNIHSWFYRGTIECRMFNGTINPDDIVNWGIMWATLVEYSMLNRDETVAQDMIGTPLACLNRAMKNNKKLLDFIGHRVREYSNGRNVGL